MKKTNDFLFPSRYRGTYRGTYLLRLRNEKSHPKMRRVAQANGSGNRGREGDAKRAGWASAAVVGAFLPEALKLDGTKMVGAYAVLVV